MRLLPTALRAAFLAALSMALWTPRASAQARELALGSPRFDWPVAAGVRSPSDGLPVPASRARPTILSASSGSDKRTGQALMIVGAAGIITGLIVDESIVTIAGAGVGGYGLFLYLR